MCVDYIQILGHQKKKKESINNNSWTQIHLFGCQQVNILPATNGFQLKYIFPDSFSQRNKQPWISYYLENEVQNC